MPYKATARGKGAGTAAAMTASFFDLRWPGCPYKRSGITIGWRGGPGAGSKAQISSGRPVQFKPGFTLKQKHETEARFKHAS
jgi:hypothetical protein